MNFKKLFSFLFVIIALINCKEGMDRGVETTIQNVISQDTILPILEQVVQDVPMKSYFTWMDSFITKANRMLPNPINEYTLVMANPWILDSLRNTDYYLQKNKGILSLNPLNINIIPKGSQIRLPDSTETKKFEKMLADTYIDVNIPEFKLRIIQSGVIMHEFPVRVGKNKMDYLDMAKREIDLRTMPGYGKIISVNKQPTFINPKDNKVYKVTKRDDGVVTKLPIIPWLEPEINGFRFGQLIHPTTNLKSLGKASSNGCIGLREADAWTVYYHAPLGTKVLFRYELETYDSLCQTIVLDDIYPGFDNPKIRDKEIKKAANEIKDMHFDVCKCIE